MQNLKIRRPIYVVLVACTLCSVGYSEGLFPDKNLEAVVRKNVFEKRNNKEPLTEKDVENISTITGKAKGIKDLTGLEKCYSLAALDLEGNEITDLSPLKELDNIQTINLSKNKISDIAPLEKLVRLQYLELSDNQITNVEPLAKMENMRSLYLSGNQIKKIDSIGNLTKIWSLYLDKNKVENLSPVSKLKWLSNFGLRDCGVSDLTFLQGLTELKLLMLDKNKIEDLSAIVAMAKQDASGAQRFAPFWRIYLTGNPLSDNAKGAQLEELKKLGAKIEFE